MSTTDPRQDALSDWLKHNEGYQFDRLSMVSGDASFRRYFRFPVGESSRVAVDAPPQHEDNPRFLAVAEAYLQAGVKVPECFGADIQQGFMCLQDFGNDLLFQVLQQDNIKALYQKSLAQLPAIQSVTATSQGPLPAFDTLLEAEFYLFNHWLLEVHLNLSLSAADRDMIQQAQAAIQQVFQAQPQAGVHRDYHSRNLMILADDEIGIVDFQDAVTGPVTYDAVSLLRDCYVTWPDEWVEEQLQQWHQSCMSQYDWQEFKYWFDFTGMQRHIKASGIFARLCHRDGKTGYLQDIPATLRYLVNIGGLYPETAAFAQWIEAVLIPAVEQGQ